MRNGFGIYAQELRAKRNLSQSEFSKLVGLSLSRVSNIEYQRTNISEETIRLYLKALKCSGEEACELRKRAIFANEVRKVDDSSSGISPLLALFKQFSDRVSPESRAEIQKILERETGERISALHFSSNKSKQSRGKASPQKRPNLTTSTLGSGLIANR